MKLCINVHALYRRSSKCFEGPDCAQNLATASRTSELTHKQYFHCVIQISQDAYRSGAWPFGQLSTQYCQSLLKYMYKLFTCLLALSLSAHWHTYIHTFKTWKWWQVVQKWRVDNYIYWERIYKACLRYLPILHNSFLFCTDNSCTSLKTEGLDQ